MEQKFTVPKGCKIESVEHDDNQIVIMFSEDKKKEVRTWVDLLGKEVPKGIAYISTGSQIVKPEGRRPFIFNERDGNTFIDEKHAKSALAMAQISQLMEYFGGKITDEEWSNINILKYVIARIKGKLDCAASFGEYIFLAFHTAEQRDKFLKYNEQLVKDYLMLD